MKILFCIPAYGGSVRAETMLSVSTGVIQLSKNFPSAEIRLFTVNMAEIARVRNIFASMLLDQGYDALFMLDSDMGVPPETFSRLLASGHDVCGLTYPRRQIDLAKFHQLAQAGQPYDACHTGALSFIAAGGFVHNNGQIDIRENLICLGSTLKFQCPCHTLIHAGKIKRDQLLAIVAKREGTTPEAIIEKIQLIRRTPK